MILLDVNVLVYAFRDDSVNHENHRLFVNSLVNGSELFGVCDLAFSGFLRIVTNQRIFVRPDNIEEALVFTEHIRRSPSFRLVNPGSAHWSIFTRLCRKGKLRSNQIPDAYFAALAIEHGDTWVTSDKGFDRFKGLNWRLPF